MINIILIFLSSEKSVLLLFLTIITFISVYSNSILQQYDKPFSFGRAYPPLAVLSITGNIGNFKPEGSTDLSSAESSLSTLGKFTFPISDSSTLPVVETVYPVFSLSFVIEQTQFTYFIVKHCLIHLAKGARSPLPIDSFVNVINYIYFIRLYRMNEPMLTSMYESTIKNSGIPQFILNLGTLVPLDGVVMLSLQGAIFFKPSESLMHKFKKLDLESLINDLLKINAWCIFNKVDCAKNCNLTLPHGFNLQHFSKSAGSLSVSTFASSGESVSQSIPKGFLFWIVSGIWSDSSDLDAFFFYSNCRSNLRWNVDQLQLLILDNISSIAKSAAKTTVSKPGPKPTTDKLKPGPASQIKSWTNDLESKYQALSTSRTNYHTKHGPGEWSKLSDNLLAYSKLTKLAKARKKLRNKDESSVTPKDT